MTALELEIVRLQVQVRPLKPGRAPWRVYEPAALQRVWMLAVSADGSVGVDVDGTEYLDVHNRTHPQTRDRKGRAGISVMATGDYLALRERYGPHVLDGIAGESVLVDYAPGLAGRPMPESVSVRGPDGDPLTLAGVHIAEPCVEFSRFCLRLPPSDRVGDDVTTALADLGGGARGYKMAAVGTGRIRVGDVLLIGPLIDTAGSGSTCC